MPNGRRRFLTRAWRLTLVRHTAWALVAAAVLLGLSSALSPYRDLQLAQVGYITCAAAGLTVLTGLGGQISLGHGAFMAVGAYTAALLLNRLGWPLPLVLAAAAAGTAVVGLVVGVGAARLYGPYLAGATLALAVGLPGLADYGPLTDWLGGQNGLSVTPSPPPLALGETFPLERWQAWISCLATVVAMWFLANLTHGRFGRSLRASRDDEIAAALSGIRVARVRIAASVAAAASAGLGGALLAVVATLAAPGAFPLTLSLELLAAIILGGLGSLAGAVWGALILVLVPSWASDFATSAHLSHDVASNLPPAIFGVVLIGVMLLFPRGLQGGIRLLGGRLLRGRAPSRERRRYRAAARPGPQP
ncbi:MAG TPA: branched-chain amino acid ABC transporter permease [Streptosporangiaceae bacterium]